MARPFHEPLEPEDIFDRAEAQERRARIEAARADHEVMARHEAEQEAIRKENARVNMQRANEATGRRTKHAGRAGGAADQTRKAKAGL